MDNAATSFPKPEGVARAVYEQIGMGAGSAKRGGHRGAAAASRLVTDTREAMAKLFHISQPEQIAFTMNGTQALNLAILGSLAPGDHVISTNMEHHAVARPLAHLAKNGVSWTQIPAENGLDTEALRRAIRPNTRMICMLHASNVTGAVFPIREVGQIAREYGVRFLVDTAQSAGALDIDVERDGIDLLAFTGHKGLWGIQGTGGLYVRSGILLRPVLFGGTGSLSESLEPPPFMPDLLEVGTMNLPGLAGLKAGVDFILETGRERILKREQEWMRRLWDGLREIRGVRLYGSENPEQRVAVVSFSVENADAQAVGRFLEEKAGIISRSGLHCAALAHRAIGTGDRGTCRLSPGYFTKEEEIETVIRTVADCARAFR